MSPEDSKSALNYSNNNNQNALKVLLCNKELLYLGPLMELLRDGANPNLIINGAVESHPLHIACLQKAESNIIAGLLLFGADPVIAQVEDKIPEELKPYVIKSTDDSSTIESKRKSLANHLLMQNIMGQSMDVTILLDKGADINMVHPEGYTLLQNLLMGKIRLGGGRKMIVSVIKRKANVDFGDVHNIPLVLGREIGEDILSLMLN